MGYTIRIGERAWVRRERTLWTGERKEHRHQGVLPTTRSDAARFVGNETLDWQSNTITMSYDEFEDFLRATGLRDTFLAAGKGLLAQYPGCVSLDYGHVEAVEGAIGKWQATHPGTEPGVGDGKDQTLACLLWFASWMCWARDNCRNPAISNEYD